MKQRNGKWKVYCCRSHHTTPYDPPTRFEEEQKNFAISIENDRRRTEARKRALKERTFLQKLGKLGYTDRTLDDNLVDFGAIDNQFGTIAGVPTGFVGPAISKKCSILNIACSCILSCIYSAPGRRREAFSSSWDDMNSR